ncbi:MAG: ArnT family glycosyltransferase [Rudaea sp.]
MNRAGSNPQIGAWRLALLFAAGFLLGLLLVRLGATGDVPDAFIGGGFVIVAISMGIALVQVGKLLVSEDKGFAGRMSRVEAGSPADSLFVAEPVSPAYAAVATVSVSARLNSGSESWRALVRAHPVRVAGLALAALLSLLAVADSLAVHHAGAYTTAVSSWLAANLVFAACFVPWRTMRPVSADLGAARVWISSHRRELFAVTIVLLLGLVLRTVDLEHIPANFAGDEGEMGLQARLFLQGKPISPFATSWMGHQTMWFWLQSLVLHFFGQSVASLRLLSALFGILGLLTCFLLVRELFGARLAAITTFLLAVFPFQLHFSRIAVSSIADPFWSALVFFLLVRGARTRQIGYFVAGGIALGFSQYFYHGMRLLIITLAMFFAYWLVQDRRVLLANVRNWAAGVAASLVTAAPLIGYYLVQPDKFWEHYNGMGIVPSGWLARTIEQTGQSAPEILIDRFRQALLSYNLIPDYSPFYAPGTPLLDQVSGLLFVLGAIYALYRIRDRRYCLFLEWFVLALILGVVMIIDENGSERVVTTAVPVMFFVALGLDRFAGLVSRLWRRSIAMNRAVVLTGLVGIAVIGVRFYFVDYTALRSYSGDGGWRFTEMSRYFLAQHEEFEVYFFGAPYDFIDHGTIRYMVPGLNGMDVQDPLAGPPDFVDRSRLALFVFTPKRPGDFPIVASAFPNGQRIDYFKPDGEELFWIYRVEPR